MPEKIKGNVAGLEIQPGWTIESDGEGLVTSRVTFRGKKGSEGNRPKQNDAHPEDANLLCYKSSYTSDASWVTVTADYIGIEGGGSKTKIRWNTDFSSSSQPIKTHPNFLKVSFQTDAPLKDKGWSDEQQRFDENNEDAVDAGLVGISAYLAPEQTVGGMFYTSDQEYVQKWVDGIAKTFVALPDTNGLVILSTYKPISANHDTRALLTGVAYERYAHLYKVTFTSRVATGGWNKLIYDKNPTT